MLFNLLVFTLSLQSADGHTGIWSSNDCIITGIYFHDGTSVVHFDVNGAKFDVIQIDCDPNFSFCVWDHKNVIPIFALKMELSGKLVVQVRDNLGEAIQIKLR